MRLTEILDDLRSEYDALDDVLRSLPDDGWDAPTPAGDWTVRDQVSHLAFSEELASLAASDGTAFAARLEELLADLDQAERVPREKGRTLTPGELHGWWRDGCDRTLVVLDGHAAHDRIPWIGTEMSTISFATARLMETWAHGQDIADAVGIDRPATARLQHIAHLGVRTRTFSYRIRGQEPPDGDVAVDLGAPDGERWTWGSSDTDKVSGPAQDFCLVVTQRRHAADTRLTIEGPRAREWMSIAQAFAGPPGPGRRAGQFV